MLGHITDPAAAGGLDRRELPDPEPGPHDGLVSVRAYAVTRGELSLLEQRPDGWLPGQDVAGVVARAAADGSGPPEGTRVVGFDTKAWAQRVAVPTRNVAALPDGVSFEHAACLPVAGMTALLALDIAGNVLARRVLVTGASGGVGRIAVQLAKRAGAHVTGVSASPERARGLAELGADAVIHDLQPEGDTFDVIVEGVGGESLGAALQRVAGDGIVVSFASSDQSPTQFPARSLFVGAAGARLYGLYVFHELDHRGGAAPLLTRLAALVAAGELDTQIDLQVSWRDAAQAIRALTDRQVAGKAVLHVD